MGPLPLAIRQATVVDLDLVFRLHVDSVQAHCGSHYDEAQMDAWFAQRSGENYRRAVERGALWIAESKGEPVGFTEFFPGLISMLFVRGGSSGQGVGRRLLAFAVEAAAADGDVIKLESTLNAQVFYECYGFEMLGPSHLIRPGGVTLPTVLMMRRL